MVAALLLDWVVEEATIARPENCIDRLLVLVSEPQTDPHRAFRRLIDLGPRIAIALAGPIAEAIRSGGDRSDLVTGVKAAAEASLLPLLSHDQVDALIGRAVHIGDRIVSHPASSRVIYVVAGALVERKSLTAQQLDELVRPLLPRYQDLWDGGPPKAPRAGPRPRRGR